VVNGVQDVVNGVIQRGKWGSGRHYPKKHKQKKEVVYRPPSVDFDLPLLTYTVTNTVDYELLYSNMK